MNVTQTIAALLIGAVSGFVGAISGGGGLISIPFLIFLGLPPQIALATNKFGGIGGAISGVSKYIKEGKVVWKYAIPLSIAGVLASFIGSSILLSIDTNLLNKLIGIFLLLLVPSLFLNKDFGLKTRFHSKYRNYLGYLAYFFIAIIGSFFGGIGAISIAMVVFFLGLPLLEASATEYFSFGVLSFIAVIIYISHGLVNFQVGAALFVGMTIGAYLGAHLAVKKGNNLIKVVYAIVVIASAIKVLLK